MKQQRIGGVRESQFKDLGLAEYVAVKESYCRLCHQECKQGCNETIKAAKIILDEKQVTLPSLWRRAFPMSNYDCEKAQRRLLQMPVASLRLAGRCFIVAKREDGHYDAAKREICAKHELSNAPSSNTVQIENSMKATPSNA